MVVVSEWPTHGERVLVWSERPPSSTPRDPHETTVDHVAGRTFTVASLDATFNRSHGPHRDRQTLARSLRLRDLRRG